MNVPSVWIRLDDAAYREILPHELIDVTAHGFPVFDSIPNELPRDTKLRWRTEYMSLGLRQIDWLQQMLCTVYFANVRIDAALEVLNHKLLRITQGILDQEGDKLLAHKHCRMFRTQVQRAWHHDFQVTEFETKFSLYGSTQVHTIHLTSVKP